MPQREYTVQFTQSEQISIDYFLANMHWNKAYQPVSPGSPKAMAQLAAMKERYLAYRHGWRGIPEAAISQGLHDRFYSEMQQPPHSVDIEVASVCDLACPHCYRQYIATPDKLITDELFYRAVDQCAELGVPSIKFNWRGEPLLHPKLPEYIAYAKQKGILETAINTNAVTLTAEKSRKLIEAGLDLMIYSFDGGTAETYNKIRQGRYKENHFEAVCENIQRFHAIREELESPFPRTRIQMVLTPDAMNEIDAFRQRFEPIVDDVLIKAYEERGWELDLLNDSERQQLKAKQAKLAQVEPAAAEQIQFWKKPNGTLLYATHRLPCQQIYQRLMVSYDGSVYMCCNDWGNEHPVGYLDEGGIDGSVKDYEAVYEQAQSQKQGFELLAAVQLPQRYNQPERRVSTLAEIWDSAELNAVRSLHLQNRVNEIPACKKCTFRDTFRWEEL